MIFTPTALAGVWIIDPEPVADERGMFARTWCAREFAEHGLNAQIAQCNVSFNHRRGTVRGMHYQLAPHQEAKLVRCTAGAIFDVALDVRPGSPTWGQHVGVTLCAGERRMLYIAEGCAHGFQTLEDGSEVFYQMSEFYAPELGRGVRWDDPAFGIVWPEPVTMINERDRSYPDVSRP